MTGDEVERPEPTQGPPPADGPPTGRPSADHSSPAGGTIAPESTGVSSGPAGTAPEPPVPRRRAGALVPVCLAVAGLAVGAGGWRVRGPEPGLEVVESGASAAARTGDQPATVLTWGAVVGNAGSRTAEHPVFDLEVLDGDGLETYILRFDHLAPGATTGVGGTVDDEGAEDVRVVPRCTGGWRDTNDDNDGHDDVIAVDEVEVGATHENAAVVRYRATSHHAGPVGQLETNLVYRDADGRIVGGDSSLVISSMHAPVAWSSGEMPSGTFSAVMSTRVAASTGVTSQVIVMVPAKAGSSDTKSTACTTRTSGTMSTKRTSTTSASAVALPGASEASS